MTPEEIKKYIDMRHAENVRAIAAFRKENFQYHQAQDKKLTELLVAFNNTTGFFKVTVSIAKYIIAVGGAVAVVWAGITFLKK